MKQRLALVSAAPLVFSWAVAAADGTGDAAVRASAGAVAATAAALSHSCSRPTPESPAKAFAVLF